jgi:hypothetical protein
MSYSQNVSKGIKAQPPLDHEGTETAVLQHLLDPMLEVAG